MGTGTLQSPIREVDWDNIQIVETHDEEGRIELVSEDQLCEILGLKDEEEEPGKSEPKGRRMAEQEGDNEGAAIPVSDAIPNEIVITYDKDHPKMDLGTMYPSMKEFRLAVRQFSINEEFELGTEKSDKKRFRGFCKSSEDCPWRIVGSLQDDKCTVKVTLLVDQHDYIKCDYITNNVEEVFNNWIRDIKDLPVAELADKVREMIMLFWRKRRRIGERLPSGRILPAIMVQQRANTRGLGHLKVVESTNWSVEVSCLEWQHTGKPCQHVLAFVTSQKRVNLEQFVHEYYSVDRFRAAYGREIEPMTDKSQWPRVELPFVVGAPLKKRNKGRQRKLRIKGCLEGGHKKKDTNDGSNNGSAAPTNAKGRKMIRDLVTYKKCGEKGHRQASYKCLLNGTKKRKGKPRKNNTKAWPAEPSTPQRPTREQILQDSPSMATRSHLAFLLGEGSSSQANIITPERMPTAAPPKKMTPKRMPTAAPPKKMTPKRKLQIG